MVTAKAYASDPKSMEEARVRPRDLDAEAWSLHATERQNAGWGH